MYGVFAYRTKSDLNRLLFMNILNVTSDVIGNLIGAIVFTINSNRYVHCTTNALTRGQYLTASRTVTHQRLHRVNGKHKNRFHCDCPRVSTSHTTNRRDWATGRKRGATFRAYSSLYVGING